jgi:hypothetical protein
MKLIKSSLIGLCNICNPSFSAPDSTIFLKLIGYAIGFTIQGMIKGREFWCFLRVLDIITLPYLNVLKGYVGLVQQIYGHFAIWNNVF